MGKVKSKKGIFFTLIAITLMALFILVFTPQADVSYQVNAQSVKTRIDSIDNYVNDLETSYAETVLRGTTYKSILSLILYINSTGSFLTDLNSAFSEVMIFGTINTVPIDSITGKKIMENNTLINWSNKIAQTARDTLNVNTTIRIIQINISQKNPWTVESTLAFNLSVNSNVAQWNKSITVTSTNSIEGFPDPYYLVNTKSTSSYTNQIKKSSVEVNQWNITQVREHLRNGTYVHWQDSDAPSFLMRLTNTITNSSCCGIESLVNPNKITPSDQIESYVDYLFWTHKFNSNCTQLFNITNPQTNGGLWDEFRFFKLDFNHVTRYNITSDDAVASC